MQGHNGVDFFFAAQHTAFEFEVLETIAILRSLGQFHNGFWGKRFFVSQALPVVVSMRFADVGQVCFLAICQVKQIAQNLHAAALLAFA